jgi:hypothetical protein
LILDFPDPGLSNKLFIARITVSFIFSFFTYKNTLRNQLHLSLAAVYITFSGFVYMGRKHEKNGLGKSVSQK